MDNEENIILQKIFCRFSIIHIILIFFKRRMAVLYNQKLCKIPVEFFKIYIVFYYLKINGINFIATNSLDVLNSSTINDVLMPVDTTPFQIAKVQLNYRPVLLFFYYGAMILAAMRHYKAAFLYLEHAICLPATRLSAITLECLKKYILIGLILDYPNPLLKLPDYRPNVIQRIAVPMAITYVRMAQVYAKARINHQDVAEAVQNYLQPHREDFQKVIYKSMII